jgi:hypothetical protein
MQIVITLTDARTFQSFNKREYFISQKNTTQVKRYSNGRLRFTCLIFVAQHEIERNDKNLRKDLFPTFVKEEANAFVSREISSEIRYTSQELCN